MGRMLRIILSLAALAVAYLYLGGFGRDPVADWDLGRGPEAPEARDDILGGYAADDARPTRQAH